MKTGQLALCRMAGGRAALLRVLSVTDQAVELTDAGGPQAWYRRTDVFRMDSALLSALVRARAAGDTAALEALWDQAVPWAPGGAGRLKGTARARP